VLSGEEQCVEKPVEEVKEEPVELTLLVGEDCTSFAFA
jgi:hypothetical protein